MCSNNRTSVGAPFLFPSQPLPLRGPWQNTDRTQTVYQPEILSTCDSSTFKPTTFCFVLEKKHKLYMLRSAKNLLGKHVFLLFCLSPYYLRFLDMFFQISIKNLRFLSSFMVLAQRNAVLESRPSWVMYKVAHFHTGVAFTEKYPRKHKSLSKINEMD